jgi:hypothetical protein
MTHFIAGKPVKGKDLIGRDKLLNEIHSLLKSGQSIVLIAPRRYGKTSILLELLNRGKKDKIFTLNLDFFSIINIRDLAEKITEGMLANKKLDKAFYNFKTSIGTLMKQIEFKHVVEDFEFILDFAGTKINDFQLLNNSIKFIESYSKRNNTQTLIGFDEFGDITKLDGDKIAKLFRTEIQHQDNTSYIFAGSYESVMSNLFITSKSPFYRFARIIKLGMINKEEYKTHIMQIFGELGVNIKEPIITEIINFTKGHPYYTQLICQHIELNYKNTDITEKKLNKIIEDVMWIEINYLEKLWEEITKSRENIPALLAIARNSEKIYSEIGSKGINVSRALRSLMKTGIIEKKDKNYIITDPYLTYWINHKVIN